MKPPATIPILQIRFARDVTRGKITVPRPIFSNAF